MGVMRKVTCLFFVLACLTYTSDSQDSQSGFISIDCGSQKDINYTDATTGLRYISDDGLIDTGISKSISDAFMDNTLKRQFLNVRSFSQGKRSCYLLRPPDGKFQKYLLRAQFMYGNYDGLNKSPVFDLHLGLDYWDTVKFSEASSYVTKEIIHIPSTNIMNFCLVNIGSGTPFISVLELRPLNNSIYTTEFGSLHIIARVKLGFTSAAEPIRYADDMYDRIWDVQQSEGIINTKLAVKMSPGNFYKLPLNAMSTAVAPVNPTNHLQYGWEAENLADEFYIYVHYSELEKLQINQSREYNIYLNGVLCNTKGPIVPEYLMANSYSAVSQGNNLEYELIINKTLTSTLPPIVSAIEIYGLKKLVHSQTDEKDVAAVMGIKSMYKMTRNWQGDPCAPEDYIWVGLNCSYHGSNPPRIISMNLSLSGLTGTMSPDISNLTMLQSLDLSNNNLTGKLPDFLAELESLKILNLKGNNFAGPIPVKLQEKSLHGQLSLSTDDLANSKETCANSQCEKRIRVPIIVGVSIAITVVIVTLLAIIWIAIRKRRTNTATSEVNVVEVHAESQEIEGELEKNIIRFPYSLIIIITNNMAKIIGEGSFGIVYYGKTGNTELAVKMLRQSRNQGLKELQEEARVPLRVHHRNITSLIGYCIDGENMGIVYEYMENGDLGKHLFDKDSMPVLSCINRLRIAIDAAQGLEYLHHYCNPPIVHRDIKSANILLNGELKAKLADFGLCKAFPIKGGTHISTINVAGTPGYLDPEYQANCRLTEKSDIYSFGIVLLELITGRNAIMVSELGHINIKNWVTSTLGEGDVRNIVDQRLMEDFDVESIRKVLDIAMKCASSESINRPTMNHVVMKLKECLAMEVTRQQKTVWYSFETARHSIENV